MHSITLFLLLRLEGQGYGDVAEKNIDIGRSKEEEKSQRNSIPQARVGEKWLLRSDNGLKILKENSSRGLG